MDDRILVSFPGTSAAEANKLAADLVAYLDRQAPAATVRQERTDKNSQDTGTAVALIGVTAAVSPILARGVATWMVRRTLARIKLTRHIKPNGEEKTGVEITGQPGPPVMDIIQKFLDRNGD